MADLTGMMQAAAGAAGGGDNLFIEDVFSCFLYTGTGATQTITNGIDLDGEGGLVWIKNRFNTGGLFTASHYLTDTVQGMTAATGIRLFSDSDIAANNNTNFVIAGSSGFSFGASATGALVNASGNSYVSWTFRKAPKFFDVVTYTGTGANRTVAHNLGSVPGSIWVKRTDTTGDWQVYHRANTAAPETDFLILNSTAATADSNTRWNDTLPTDTVFTVGTEATVNASGGTYVAYLFAHNDGGFGDDGTENAITCGSFTVNGSGNADVNLGYEPQWALVKAANIEQNWIIVDTMRGNPTFIPATSNQQQLKPNTADAENSNYGFAQPTSTGFIQRDATNNATFIFIAIRRGPMKTPTAGTEVFDARFGANTADQFFNVGFNPDFLFSRDNVTATSNNFFGARLTGQSQTTQALLNSAATSAEAATSGRGYFGAKSEGYNYGDARTSLSYALLRAPGFMDVVCYTGTGSVRTVEHNLSVAPELIIWKQRSATSNWVVFSSAVGMGYLSLNQVDGNQPDTSAQFMNNTNPTASVFTVGSDAGHTNPKINASGATYVAYLFASLAGVSDIGTYTGNGTSLTVTTGFQPRFIMVKRTNSTGNWIVGDSARGLVAGNDPALFLNTTAAETTGQDWVDVSATGFTVNETALNANVSTGVYLYWAIS